MRKSEPDKHEPVSRLLIIDDANRCVYGRGLLEGIALGHDKGKVHKVVGIQAEVLIVYLAHELAGRPGMPGGASVAKSGLKRRNFTF
jgi:hypothetical protein